MNDHLEIPLNVQILINTINTIDLNLSELPLPEHPRLPQFNRSIRVLDIDVKSKQEFISFNYEQVLRDKTTGEEVNIALPTPEWLVYKETWSFLRDEQNKPIELPLAVPTEEIEKDKVKVPSYKYMLWLLKNNRVGLLDLLKSYLHDFIEIKTDELNKL